MTFCLNLLLDTDVACNPDNMCKQKSARVKTWLHDIDILDAISWGVTYDPSILKWNLSLMMMGFLK
jgi:hypothetical protein